MRGSDMQRDVLYDLAKILVPCHKVGLTVHFHEHSDFPLQVDIRSHNAFLRRARGLFPRDGDAFHSQNCFCCFQFTAALCKSALTIHKAGVGFFPELLNQMWVNFHGKGKLKS